MDCYFSKVRLIDRASKQFAIETMFDVVGEPERDFAKSILACDKSKLVEMVDKNVPYTLDRRVHVEKMTANDNDPLDNGRITAARLVGMCMYVLLRDNVDYTSGTANMMRVTAAYRKYSTIGSRFAVQLMKRLEPANYKVHINKMMGCMLFHMRLPTEVRGVRVASNAINATAFYRTANSIDLPMTMTLVDEAKKANPASDSLEAKIAIACAGLVGSADFRAEILAGPVEGILKLNIQDLANSARSS